MPNWCFNNLSVYGPESDLTDFLSKVRKNDEQYIDFNGIIPMPEELINTTSPNPDPESDKSKELRAKYGADDWYEWAIKNWGTKWNATSIDDWEVEEDKTSAQIVFDTAWSQPTEWLLNASKIYPNLSFDLDYYEEGNCFIGHYNIKDGAFEIKDEPEWDSEEGIGLRKDAGIYNEEELEEEDSE